MKGKITAWKDGHGFGFIAPDGGGAPIFLHVKAFAWGARRPLAGDLVTHEPALDASGRARAG